MSFELQWKATKYHLGWLLTMWSKILGKMKKRQGRYNISLRNPFN